MGYDAEALIIRICSSCGAAASQKPNGSFKCLKCDPTVSYQEFVDLIRRGVVSDDQHVPPSGRVKT